MADSDSDNVVRYIATTVETIRDRLDGMEERMATKGDINRLEVATTALRGDVEQVQLRLDSMDHSIASRFEYVEGELSRLRSAVYVLGKDRPDVLRLLGH